MATRRIKDLTAVSGGYTNAQGDTKKRYVNVGTLMETDDGNQFIMLNRHINFAAFPHKEGSESVLISMFDIKERDGQSGGQSSNFNSKPSTGFNSALDDDVPF